MSGPRHELRERIKAKILPNFAVGDEQWLDEVSDRIMSLFFRVEDEWREIDITTLGENGRTSLDERFLVAWVPVQSVRHERPVDRSVP